MLQARGSTGSEVVISRDKAVSRCYVVREHTSDQFLHFHDTQCVALPFNRELQRDQKLNTRF